MRESSLSKKKRRRAEPPPGPEAGAAEQLIQAVHEGLPFEEYVKAFGPIHRETWLRRIAGVPEARADFAALVLDARGNVRTRMGKTLLGRMLACIRRHPQLLGIVEREHAIQRAHLTRSLLLKMCMVDPASKDREWKEIFDQLEAVLERHRSPGPSGVADFHLMEHPGVETAHKIDVVNPEAITPALVKEIQAALGGRRNEWCVLIELNVDALGLDADSSSICVWADRVDEMWDRDRLRALLGPRFRA